MLSTKKEHAAVLFVGLILGAVALVELAVAISALVAEERAPPAGAAGSTAAAAAALDAHYPTFLVVGDWGRDGRSNQSVVAAAMAATAGALPGGADFVVSTGDNFYEAGLVSAEDPQFNSSFTAVYSQPSLQVPWYAVLGNHDYGEVWSAEPPPCPPGEQEGGDCHWGPVHQLRARLAQRDGRWHCARRFELRLAGGDVELFFVDTSPLSGRYVRERWAGNRGGILEQNTAAQLAEFEARLAASAATWKLVVGHHPLRTNHRRDDHASPALRQALEPLLIKYGVQAYLAGHDHNLQHIYTPGTGYQQVTSGAGSEVTPGFFADVNSPFQYGRNGYVLISMARDSMRIDYYGVDSAEPLFSVTVPPAMERAGAPPEEAAPSTNLGDTRDVARPANGTDSHVGAQQGLFALLGKQKYG